MDDSKQKVKALRRQMGWTQEDLAGETGVSVSTIKRWEKRGGRPTHRARRELLRLYQEAGIQ